MGVGDGGMGSSAGFQPAVSPIWNRRGFEISRGVDGTASVLVGVIEVGRKSKTIESRGRLKTGDTAG